MKIVWGLGALVAVYLLICLGLFVFQRQFLYVPLADLRPPAAYGLDGFMVATAVADDGVRLVVWHRPAAEGMPTIVLFHGNGGHLGYRVPLLGALGAVGLGLVALEYRGYGPNDGTPTEEGLYRDGRAALAFARDLGVADRSIILYGESLGTGIAVQMATECSCGALVL